MVWEGELDRGVIGDKPNLRYVRFHKASHKLLYSDASACATVCHVAVTLKSTTYS